MSGVLERVSTAGDDPEFQEAARLCEGFFSRHDRDLERFIALLQRNVGYWSAWLWADLLRKSGRSGCRTKHALVEKYYLLHCKRVEQVRLMQAAEQRPGSLFA